jgi:hypothetical protein
MTSASADQRLYQMIMRKGDPGYTVNPRRALFGEGGTEVRIAPLLEGISVETCGEFHAEKSHVYTSSPAPPGNAVPSIYGTVVIDGFSSFCRAQVATTL